MKNIARSNKGLNSVVVLWKTKFVLPFQLDILQKKRKVKNNNGWIKTGRDRALADIVNALRYRTKYCS